LTVSTSHVDNILVLVKVKNREKQNFCSANFGVYNSFFTKKDLVRLDIRVSIKDAIISGGQV
jgi:hypothetical protein